MKLRRFSLILCLALCLSLCGCSAAKEAVSKAAPAAASPTPARSHFAAGDVELTAETLKMPLAAGETALLDQLTALRSADFSGSANEEEVAAWALSHPQVSTRYTVTLPNGTVLDSDTRSVDLSGLSAADCEAAAIKLALLPNLETVKLGREGGALGWNDISRLRSILPRPVFQYGFKLYGKDCDLSDTSIDLFRASITDNGNLIDQVIDYMPQLASVDMDSCTLDVKRLEEINLRHPNTKVIFRVYFGDNYTARTDAERILASMASRGGMLNNDNVAGLYYCHDVKYLDLGHNTSLQNIGFCAQMPKLEVAILSMCDIRDISPLSSCPELEYLEIANTYCEDLRPLSGLTKLRHLNIAGTGYDFYGDGERPSLKDISPLYPLTGLERLWIGAYNPVPAEQVSEMQRRAPQCEIDLSVYDDPVGGRWRYLALPDYITTYVIDYAPRYLKLREQFGDYEYSVYNFTWNDPRCDPNYVPTAATPAPSATPIPTPAPTAYYPQPTYYPEEEEVEEEEDEYADNTPVYVPDPVPVPDPYLSSPTEDPEQGGGEEQNNEPEQPSEPEQPVEPEQPPEPEQPSDSGEGEPLVIGGGEETPEAPAEPVSDSGEGAEFPVESEGEAA